MTTPKFPDVEVKLVGQNGNAYAILAAVRRGLRKAEVSNADVDRFVEEATAGDYDNLLRVCMAWVVVV